MSTKAAGAARYVWLGANSSFKSESDLLKYEKARKLKDYIVDIRKNYTRDWDSSDLCKKQVGQAQLTHSRAWTAPADSCCCCCCRQGLLLGSSLIGPVLVPLVLLAEGCLQLLR